VIEPENRVEFVVRQRPVGRCHRAEHVGVEVDLVERDEVMEAIIEIVSHRSTSVAEASPSGREAGPCGREQPARCLPAYGLTPWPRMTHEDHF